MFKKIINWFTKNDQNQYNDSLETLKEMSSNFNMDQFLFQYYIMGNELRLARYYQTNH